MDLINSRGGKVSYYDPYVPVIKPTREHPHWAGAKSIEWTAENIRTFDVVVVATAHSTIDFDELFEWSDLIVDTRNAIRRNNVPGKVWSA